MCQLLEKRRALNEMGFGSVSDFDMTRAATII